MLEIWHQNETLMIAISFNPKGFQNFNFGLLLNRHFGLSLIARFLGGGYDSFVGGYVFPTEEKLKFFLSLILRYTNYKEFKLYDISDIPF